MHSLHWLSRSMVVHSGALAFYLELLPSNSLSVLEKGQLKLSSGGKADTEANMLLLLELSAKKGVCYFVVWFQLYYTFIYAY